MQAVFDQGLTETGCCVFLDKKPIESASFKPQVPKGTGLIERCDDLWLQINGFLNACEYKYKRQFDHFYLEEFEKFVKPEREQGLRKTYHYTGYLRSKLQDFRNGSCVNIQIPVKFISKGKAPKAEGEMLAKHFKLNIEEMTEHEIDAFHLGYLERLA